MVFATYWLALASISYNEINFQRKNERTMPMVPSDFAGGSNTHGQ